jgi:hypothetical protein
MIGNVFSSKTLMDPLLEGTVPRGGADALRTFRDAFVTEIGAGGSELGAGVDRLISLRELLDVIICAGKDVLIQVGTRFWILQTHTIPTFEDLRRLRPYASDKGKVLFTAIIPF